MVQGANRTGRETWRGAVLAGVRRNTVAWHAMLGLAAIDAAGLVASAPALAEGLVTRPALQPVPKTVQHVAAAVRAEGWVVFGEIDHAAHGGPNMWITTCHRFTNRAEFLAACQAAGWTCPPGQDPESPQGVAVDIVGPIVAPAQVGEGGVPIAGEVFDPR